MMAKSIPAGRQDAVIQFSVFTPNRLGRLHELIGLLAANHVHVLALCVLDNSDSAVIRLIVDDPDKARDLMAPHDFPFSETEILVVELKAATDLNRLMTAFLEAEINVNYVYAFIPHPHNCSRLALSMEDNDMAEQILRRHQFSVLKQSDISR